MDIAVTGEHLPFQDHAARYCPGSRISADGTVSATAFFLRRGEKYLSAEWLEHLKESSRVDEIRTVIDILSRKLQLGASARLAVLNVGAVCSHVTEASGFRIRFMHEPEPDDPAHSGIWDTNQDEMMISELIAQKVYEMHPVKAR